MVRICALAALFAGVATEVAAQGVATKPPEPDIKIPPAVSAVLPPRPDSRHPFVMDSAHVLTMSEIEALQDSSRQLKRAMGVDVVFITLPTIGSATVDEIVLAVRQKWKAGQGALTTGDVARNRSIIVLVIPERSPGGGLLRVDAGKGMASIFPDSSLQNTIDVIRPLFKERRYGTSMIAGFRTMSRLMRTEMLARQNAITFPPPRPTDFMSTAWPMRILIGVVFVSLVTWGTVSLRRAKRKRDARLHRKHHRRSVPHQGMLLPARRVAASEEIVQSRQRAQRNSGEHEENSKPPAAAEPSDGDSAEFSDRTKKTRRPFR